MKRICRIAWAIVIIVVVLLVVLTGASFYMLDYSLSPDATRENADLSYRQLYEDYPETAEWVDSLRRKDALRDTFLTMANGERHHAYYVHKGSRKTALVIHGWRDQAIKYFFLGRMYERELGYNIVMPDLHASGKSEGEAIGMGWNDRLDVMQWMQTFQTDTMVVHGVSMGAATCSRCLYGGSYNDDVVVNADAERSQISPIHRGLRIYQRVGRVQRTAKGTVRIARFPIAIHHESALSTALWLGFQRGFGTERSSQMPLPHAVYSWRQGHLRTHRNGVSPL